MSSSTASAADSSIDMRYPSLAALQTAHNDLLKRQRLESDTPVFQDAVLDFLRNGTTTGALLDADDDRRAAQSVLDYWVARLFRLSQEQPDSTLADFDPLLTPQIPDELCPYLGLDAFTEQDAEKFYGRTHLITELVERLASHRLIAAVGPSGSGKSSLVRAGLIPVLKTGELPGSQDWNYLSPIVPGSDPLASLARVLDDRQRAIASDQPSIDGVDDGQPIADSEQPTTSVLVIDQFEELWTLCDDEGARQRFIVKLLALTEARDAEHRVILTMRSDFETFVARAPELQALFEAGRVQVTPLSVAELREAIEQPAEAIGLKFEGGVVDLLLQDILGEPAGLPLLQFTLLKLWERRERNRITRAAYEQVGGGRLALARSADAFYASLIPEEQTTARRILLRMIRPGEGLEITSSRVRRRDLFRSGEDPGRVGRVLAKLVDQRLVRLTAGDTPSDDQVEVAHEALVRNWPTLVDWLEEEKVALATRRRLEGRAAEWVRLGQGTGGLLDEVELHEAKRWLNSSEAAYLGYDPVLSALVEASQTAIVKRTRRMARLRLALVAISLIAAILGIGLAVFAFQQREAAMSSEQQAIQNAAESNMNAAAAVSAQVQIQAQKQIVESQQLAFAANSQLDSASETALLLVQCGLNSMPVYAASALPL